MGCISSKILTKSGSFKEKGSLSHSFQRSNMIEDIILSTSKSNGDQFLTLLCASNSTATNTKAKEPEQSPAAAAKIETINVSELLAGLDEENNTMEQSERENGDKSPAARCVVSDGGAAADGRARSFRTVEDFDALVARQGGGEPRTAAAATAEPAESGGGGPSGQGAKAAGGERRRARARQLGELKVPATGAFDFSKSGSLRDWLRHGGQIFSPGSYVTPKFGTAAVTGEQEGGQTPSEQEEEHDLFDPELVAQFERAMEQLSEDEGRVLEEILVAMESEAGEKDGTAVFGRASIDQPPAVAVQQV